MKETGETTHQLLRSVVEQRELRRTSKWRDQKPSLRDAQNNDHDAVQSSYTEHLEERTQRTLKFNLTTPTAPIKLKAKTRGIAIEKTPIEASAVEHESSIVSSSPISVSKRAYKVYSTIFRSVTEDGVPGELPWPDFLYAMSSAGFSIKKLDGSAWVFTPTHDVPERSIIFHEPHPASKIPFRMARQFGRRLERAYGWSGETFVCA